MKNSKIIIPVILVLIAVGAFAVFSMKENKSIKTSTQSMEESHGHSH